MGQISTFLPWRENFAPEHDASGLESIPPGNFSHFGRRTAENLDLVFLLSCDQNLGSHFEVQRNRSNFQIFPLERILL